MKKIKDLTPDEKKVLSQRIQLYGGIALIFVLCALFLRFYNLRVIETEGIIPKPDRAIAALDVTFQKQDDAAWAQDQLGETGYTMEQEGSLFSCLSMVLQTHGITETPQQINNRFMENGLYIDGNVADVTQLSVLYPGHTFSAPRLFDGDVISGVLRKGQACMVRTTHQDSAHWLCVVGANEDAFLVLDPLGDGTPIELTEDLYGKVFVLGIIK